MSKRKPISARKRFEIFKRDAFTCAYCGRKPPAVVLHVDHIIAVAEGGDNDPDNLVTSCSECNFGKGPRPLTSVPQSLEDRVAEAAERRAQVEALAAFLQEQRDIVEEWCWEIAEVLQPGASDGFNRNNFSSIKMFVSRLGYPETLDAAHIAERKPRGHQRFKYFCGICWTKIKRAEGLDG